jgi:hypothetical protein
LAVCREDTSTYLLIRAPIRFAPCITRRTGATGCGASVPKSPLSQSAHADLAPFRHGATPRTPPLTNSPGRGFLWAQDSPKRRRQIGRTSDPADQTRTSGLPRKRYRSVAHPAGSIQASSIAGGSAISLSQLPHLGRRFFVWQCGH